MLRPDQCLTSFSSAKSISSYMHNIAAVFGGVDAWEVTVVRG